MGSKESFFVVIGKETFLKKIMFAGVSSSSGKTTIVSALMRLLKRRNYKVAPYKVGPDYIDPSFHEKACGQLSRNLDEFMLEKEELRYLFAGRKDVADIHVIEGVMGLYDGYGYRIDYCSTASMAKILDCKVILILDAKSLAGSAAATVLGYRDLDKDVRIGGVIVNNVSSQSHYQILKRAIEGYTGVPVLGRIPPNKSFALPSRHLGLIPGCELDELDSMFNMMADVVEEYVDVEKILELAESSELSYDEKRRSGVRNITDVKLALARDKAFHFYYEDSLELLRYMGVELVEFSPLGDAVLPNCDGVFLGGGFPEVFAKELEANRSMRESIRRFGEDGGVIYAECGGLMYLGTSLLDQERYEYEMVGLLDGKSVMKDRLQRFGYCQGTARREVVIAKCEEEVRGHEFHYSDFETDLQGVFKMQKYQDGTLLREWEGGFAYKNVLGTYLHSHFCSNYKLALNLIRTIEQNRRVR